MMTSGRKGYLNASLQLIGVGSRGCFAITAMAVLLLPYKSWLFCNNRNGSASVAVSGTHNCWGLL